MKKTLTISSQELETILKNHFGIDEGTFNYNLKTGYSFMGGLHKQFGSITITYEK